MLELPREADTWQFGVREDADRLEGWQFDPNSKPAPEEFVAGALKEWNAFEKVRPLPAYREEAKLRRILEDLVKYAQSGPTKIPSIDESRNETVREAEQLLENMGADFSAGSGRPQDNWHRDHCLCRAIQLLTLGYGESVRSACNIIAPIVSKIRKGSFSSGTARTVWDARNKGDWSTRCYSVELLASMSLGDMGRRNSTNGASKIA